MKIKKAVLEKFIEKYTLAGSIQKVKLQVLNKELLTDFISDQKTIVGKIQLVDFDCEDLECLVYDSAQLVKFLNALSQDIDIEFIKNPTGGIRALKLSDSVKNITFSLSDVENAPKVPTPKKLPNFEVEIEVTPELIENFIKSKSALDYQTFYVAKDENDKFKFIIANSLDENANQISVDTGVTIAEPFKEAKYDSNYFKEILSANKKSLKGKISISSRGMIYASFFDGDYTSEYFLLPMTETK